MRSICKILKHCPALQLGQVSLSQQTFFSVEGYHSNSEGLAPTGDARERRALFCRHRYLYMRLYMEVFSKLHLLLQLQACHLNKQRLLLCLSYNCVVVSLVDI